MMNKKNPEFRIRDFSFLTGFLGASISGPLDIRKLGNPISGRGEKKDPVLLGKLKIFSSLTKGERKRKFFLLA